jgi:hypothetical protein
LGLTRISATHLADLFFADLCCAPLSLSARMKEAPMLSNRALAWAVGFMVLPQIGDAAEGGARCVNASAAKRTWDAHHGKWIELTSDQWQFLRAIYAIIR